MQKYKLEKLVPKERYYEVYLNADSNDGDDVATTSEYTQEKFDEIIDELINLKNNYMDSHKLENYDNVMDLDIPCNGWDGYCHTLYDIKVKMHDTDGNVYQVIF